MSAVGRAPSESSPAYAYLSSLRPDRPQDQERGCPRSTGLVCDLVTGEVFQRRCRSLRCYFCLPIQARQVAGAIALAAPNWFLTLTRAGEQFGEIRRRVNRFREYLQRAGFTFQWVWSAEPNPAGTGSHVHAWVRSDEDLLQAPLREVAGRAGLGEVADAEAVRGSLGWDGDRLDGRRTAGYALKEAVREPGLQELSEAQQRFLTLNGGRLCHASRGFWVDEQGRPVAGQRAAMRRARLLARSARVGSDAPTPADRRPSRLEMPS